MSNCTKFGCKPKLNRLGVCWCTECGKLFTFSLNHKTLDKNYLIDSNQEYYQLELKKELEALNN